MVAARPGSSMRHLIAPDESLAITLSQSRESAARPERVAYIANGPFHAAFLITPPHLAGFRREVIVRAKVDEARMKQDVTAAALEDRAFEIVVKNHARLAGPGFKRMHVTAQKVLRRLIKEELQVQGSGIRQRRHETRQGAT